MSGTTQVMQVLGVGLIKEKNWKRYQTNQLFSKTYEPRILSEKPAIITFIYLTQQKISFLHLPNKQL